MAKKDFEAAYLRAHRAGPLPERNREGLCLLESCTLCPRRCRVNRLKGEMGTCRAGCLPEVSSYSPHFGEERPLVGLHGSGTIFLTHCNLRCSFCQNYSISHLRRRPGGFLRPAGPDDAGAPETWAATTSISSRPPTMSPRSSKRCRGAIEQGLRVPLVYNSSGYDSVADSEASRRNLRHLHAGFQVRERRAGRRVLPGRRLSRSGAVGHQGNAPPGRRSGPG